MKITTLVAATALLATPALAADAVVYNEPTPVEVAQAFTWTGGYVGVNAGYAWGDSKFTDIDSYNEDYEQFSFDPDGFTGGIQAGYNWQNQNFVYGLEAELGYLNLHGTKPQPSSPEDTFASVKGGMYGGISARLGYAMDHTLFYLKAGGVYSGGKLVIDDSCDTGDCGGGLLYGSKKVGLGYQVGAGIEHAVNTNWTVKAEYAYLNFGKETINGMYLNDYTYKYSADLSAHTVKIGLNYKF